MKMKRSLSWTKRQKIKRDKFKEKCVKREGKVYSMKKDKKHWEEKGEGSASKDEPGGIRDTIRQKDSVVDPLEKEKENL